VDDNVVALLNLLAEDSRAAPGKNSPGSAPNPALESANALAALASANAAAEAGAQDAAAAIHSAHSKVWSITGKEQPGPDEHTIGEVLHCNRPTGRFTVQTGDLVQLRNKRVEAVALVGYKRQGVRPRFDVGLLVSGPDGKDTLQWIEAKHVEAHAGTCNPATVSRLTTLAVQVSWLPLLHVSQVVCS